MRNKIILFASLFLMLFFLLLTKTAAKKSGCEYPKDTEISMLDLSNCYESAIREDLLLYTKLINIDLSNTNFSNYHIFSRMIFNEDVMINAQNANIDNFKLEHLLDIAELIDLNIAYNEVSEIPRGYENIISDYNYNYISGFNSKLDHVEITINDIQYQKKHILITTSDEQIKLKITYDDEVQAIELYDLQKGAISVLDNHILLNLQNGLNYFELYATFDLYSVVYDLQFDKVPLPINEDSNYYEDDKEEDPYYEKVIDEKIITEEPVQIVEETKPESDIIIEGLVIDGYK